MNNCLVDPQGGVFLFTSVFTGDYELNGCNVIMDDGSTVRGVLMRLGGNTGTFRARNTIFDRSGATATSNGMQMFAADAENPLVELTNCVVKFQGGLAPSSAFAFQFGGDLTLKHCTIADTNPIPVGTVGMYFNDLGSLGRAGTVEVKNCIFDLSATTTPAAYIFDEADRGADNSGITYTIGKNLINGTVANTQVSQGGGVDRISEGTVVEADPQLAADKIHLSSTSSPAVDVGEAIGVTDDIDGDPRPSGAGPDIGADEASASSVETWMFY
jgi:hypothetical protein